MFYGEFMNITQKIAYNAVFSGIVKVLEIGLNLITIRLITNYLGLYGFGEYSTVVAFVYIFSVFSDLGLYSIVAREISTDSSREGVIINNALSIRVLVGAGIMIIAGLCSFIFPYSQQIRMGILITIIGNWLLNITQVLMGLFQKHLIMDRVAIAQLAGKLVQFIGIIACIVYNGGFLGILGMLIVNALVSSGLILFYANKKVKLKIAVDIPVWKELLKNSLPLAVSAVLVLIYFKLDTVMLSVMKSSDDVGVYSLAYKVMETLVFFPTMIMGLTLPILSKYVAVDRVRFNSIAQQTFNFLIIAVVPLVLGMMAIASQLIALLSSEDFYKSILVLQILALALGFIFLGAFFSNIIIIIQRQTSLAYIYLVGAVFNFITNLLFIPSYSYNGAAATTLATEVLVTLLMIWVVFKKLGWLPSINIVLKSLFAGVCMLLVIDIFSSFNVFIIIFVGAVVYGVVLFLCGGISRTDINKILQKSY